MPHSPDSPRRAPRIALVHEWLKAYAGSERVLERILEIYPQADLFAVVDFVDDAERGFLQGKRPTTTFIQKLPFAKKHFRGYLPLMPLAMEQLDLSAYDIVISSNHAVAKGVITGPDQLHVCYVHSPMRYAWDLQHQYLAESGLVRGPKSWLVRMALHYLRQWDVRSAAGVDLFIANSAFIGRRIKKAWRRDSVVVFPPVDVERFAFRADKENFYLIASRMVPYKKVPLVVAAFARMPDLQLVVIGEGADFARCQALATANVRLLGYQPQAALVDAMQRAKAFVFAAEEDFGITPVEAQACGTPVIAFGRGGSLETVRGGDGDREATGTFFAAQTVEAVIEAVRRFEAAPAGTYAAAACRRHAERFAPDRFREELTRCVDAAWRDFGSVTAPTSAPTPAAVSDR